MPRLCGSRTAPAWLGQHTCALKSDTNYDGVELSIGQSSAQLTIDEDYRQHLLELRYVGEDVRNFHDGVLDMGTSYVQHRIWLEGATR